MNAHDVWGDSDDEAPGDVGQQSLEREWQARREEHTSSGYRQGLEAGKHETVQEGFDAGKAAGKDVYQTSRPSGSGDQAGREPGAWLLALSRRLL